MMHKVPVTAL